MAKNKVELPETPQYQTDPRFQQGIDKLSGLGDKLTSFDFSGDLSPLQQAVELDPQITQLALDQAKNSLMPEFNLQRQNTINQLANTGGLQSSTASNAFAQQDQNLQQQLQAITSGAALDDRRSAINNRLGLFGQGLDTTQTATGFAGQEQNNLNTFNLQNYQNMVAKVFGEESNSGGLFGGLTGAIGGGLSGLAMTGNPFAGLGGAVAGGVAGGFGSSGTGGQLLNMGGMFAGSDIFPKNPFDKVGETVGKGKELLSKNLSELQKAGFNPGVGLGINPFA